MTQTIEQLQAQIEAAKAQIEQLKIQQVQERANAIESMKATIATFGIGRAELYPTPAAPIKYRNGDDTWTGRGQPPRWLADLEAKGVDRSAFAV